MKHSDLRTGNIVYYRVKDELDDRKEWDEIQIVDAEDILYLEACETNKWKHLYSPIPLTEEWMKKFGFVQDWSLCMATSFGKNKKISFSYLPIDKCYQLEYFGIRYINDIAIRYVHQLQNLYCAMTLEELKIKKHGRVQKNTEGIQLRDQCGSSDKECL